MFPLQYAVYKGVTGKMGAVQFNLQPPHFYNGKQKDFTGREAFGSDGKLKDGWKQREGAIFFEIASAKEANVYDWENKITLALSVNDLGKVLFTLRTGQECKIMHDPGAKSESQGAVQKYLSITSPKGTVEGVMINATMTAGGQKKSHSVGLKGDEVMVLATLIAAAIPRCLAW